MPRSVEELVDLLELEVIEDNLFRGKQPDTLMQRVFGGQVAAHALVAATRTVDPKYVVHSLHSYVLRPGDTSIPIVYDVEMLRDGRSFSTRRIVARQHGRPIFTMTASFQVPEEGWEHQDTMPSVPPPDECPAFQLTVPKQLRRAQGLEERASFKLPIEFRQATPADGKHIALWARVAGHVATPPMLGFVADFVPMGVARASGRAGGGVSLDNTIRFGPATEDEWVLVGLDPHFAYGGYGHGIAHLWAADGTLVATASQTASMVFFD